jgi:hypothetical protein
MTPRRHSPSKLRPQLLLAAILSLAVVPCATAQVRVNSIGAGHFTTGHIGGSGQLLPYIRSTQGAGSSRVNQGGGIWHGSNAQSPQWAVMRPRPERAAPGIEGDDCG